MSMSHPASTRVVMAGIAAALCALPYEALAATRGTREVAPRISAPRISVGENVHVTRDTSDHLHAQSLIAANPARPGELLACTHAVTAGGGEQISYVYSSTDAGRTWKRIFGGNDQMDGTDPTVTFGPDGMMYFAYISHPPGKLESVIVSSGDRGKSWSSAIRIDMIDRHFLMADTTEGRFRGRVYLAGYEGVPGQGSGLGIRFSDDHWRTFSDSVVLPAQDGFRLLPHSPGVVLSDGTLVFVAIERALDESLSFGEWTRERRSRVIAIRSRDGGRSLERAGVVSAKHAATSVQLAGNDFAGLAVGATGPFRDRVHVAFSSYDPHTGRRDITAAFSDDQGATWSKPIAVNDDPLPADLGASPKHFQPAIAVNKAGVVGVTWSDRRDARNGRDFVVRFAASVDGGETFSPSVAVSETPFRTDGHAANKWVPQLQVSGAGSSRKYGPFTRQDLRDASQYTSYVNLAAANFGMHHTAGLIADPSGTFHSTWLNNRTGISQVWTAPIVVDAIARRNGGGELEALQDASYDVALRYEGVVYHPGARLLTLTARLENVSTAPINGPLVLRIISTAPRGVDSVYSLKNLGEYHIANADNGETAQGAIWRFGLKDGSAVFAPGALSGPRTLQFRLTREPSFERAHYPGLGYSGGFLGLAQFDAKVLAGPESRSPARGVER